MNIIISTLLLLAIICQVLAHASEDASLNISKMDEKDVNTKNFSDGNWAWSKIENLVDYDNLTYLENSTNSGEGIEPNETLINNNSDAHSIKTYSDANTVAIMPDNYSSFNDNPFLRDGEDQWSNMAANEKRRPSLLEIDSNRTNQKRKIPFSIRPWQPKNVDNFAKMRPDSISVSTTDKTEPAPITHNGQMGTSKVIASVHKVSLHNAKYIIPNKLKRHSSYSYNVDLTYTIDTTSHASPDVRLSRNYSNSFMYAATSTVQTVIDDKSPTNVTIQLGSTAYLPCKIKNLGNKTVSWIRNRDSHILTVDRYIFIADERFQAWHDKKSGTWTLMVKYVQERDTGRYECQVSSEPKISHFVYFNVVSPRVRITGGSDIYVKVGTSISLRCIISNVLQQPEYVFWYQNNRRVISRGRGGGGGRGDKSAVAAAELLKDDVNSTTISTLDIPEASLHDAGIYHCSPERLNPAKVSLHVINGEHPAAMQHGTSVMTSATSPWLLVLVLLFQIISDLIH